MALQLLSFGLLAGGALALPQNGGTVAAYGQCGGQGWNGGSTCVSGYHCVAQNSYYSQCIPGGASSSTPAKTTTKSSSTPVKTTTSTRPASTTSKAAGSSTTSKSPVTSPATTATSTATISGNPFNGYQQYANSFYSSEVVNLAIPSLASSLVPAASAIAVTPNFFWMDTLSKVPVMGSLLDDISAKNKAGASPPNLGLFVVYDLPDRDCAAYSSNGEYSYANGGAANYQNYIDSIVAQLKAHSDVNVVLVIEPDSLGNLVTNLNVQKCANAKDNYLASYKYALSNLNLPNVAMYIDAGHAGWLGWSANIDPAAQLFAQVYKSAGSPAAVRGLATNVANYNAWQQTTCPSYTQGDQYCDEHGYVHGLAPLLTKYGFPAHFITDTGRNGVQPTAQQAWGDWCNVKGTGFGLRPSSNTGDSLLDAFVWVKPGAESDGTSNSSATRYDSHCGLSDALQPAPEAGSWFQAYFQQLLVNANPPVSA